MSVFNETKNYACLNKRRSWVRNSLGKGFLCVKRSLVGCATSWRIKSSISAFCSGSSAKYVCAKLFSCSWRWALLSVVLNSLHKFEKSSIVSDVELSALSSDSNEKLSIFNDAANELVTNIETNNNLNMFFFVFNSQLSKFM